MNPTEATRCDVCSQPFTPGQMWSYHYRLGVHVHSVCSAKHLVRGEDINLHTVLTGQIGGEKK